MVLVGNFTSVNGTTVGSFARLKTDGTLDAGFNVGGSGADGTVYSVAVQADGKLVLGGAFNKVNNTAGINLIARLNANGTLDTGFNVGGTGLDGIPLVWRCRRMGSWCSVALLRL